MIFSQKIGLLLKINVNSCTRSEKFPQFSTISTDIVRVSTCFPCLATFNPYQTQVAETETCSGDSILMLEIRQLRPQFLSIAEKY